MEPSSKNFSKPAGVVFARWRTSFGRDSVSASYPSGRVVAQSYDTIGRLCAVGTSGSTCTTGTIYANGFTYNAAQQPTAFSYGNSVSASIGYSPDHYRRQVRPFAMYGVI